MDEGGENKEIQQESFNARLRKIYDLIPVVEIPDSDNPLRDDFDFSLEDAQKLKVRMTQRDNSGVLQRGLAALQKELNTTSFTPFAKELICNEYRQKFTTGYLNKEAIFADEGSTEYILKLSETQSDGAADEKENYGMEKALLSRVVKAITEHQTKDLASTGEATPIQLYYGVNVRQWGEEFGKRTPPEGIKS